MLLLAYNTGCLMRQDSFQEFVVKSDLFRWTVEVEVEGSELGFKYEEEEEEEEVGSGSGGFLGNRHVIELKGSFLPLPIKSTTARAIGGHQPVLHSRYY